MEKLSCNHSLEWCKIQSSIAKYVRQIKQRNTTINLHQLVRSCSEHVDETFLKNCVRVCVLRQLSAMIDRFESFNEAKAVENIRETYFHMFTQGLWKQQFKFQSGVVCITKLVSEFFNQIFVDVKVNEKLEAEIYVILIYVIMGIRVGLKSFQVLERKYLKQRKKARKTCMKKRQSQKISDNLSNTFHHQNIQRKSVVENKNSSHLFDNEKSSIDQFGQFLKESLYVPPLPQIVKQKKSIQFYGQKTSPSQLQNLQSQVSTPKQKELKQQNKYRRFPFLSTQLSISMHSQIIQRNVSIATHCKPVKIKQRNPYFPNHSLVFKNNNGKNYESSDQHCKSKEKQKQEKWRMTCKQWNQAISQIKGHFANHDEKRVQKLQRVKRNQKDMEADTKLQINQGIDKSYRRLKLTTGSNLAKEKQYCSTPSSSVNQNVKNLKVFHEDYSPRKKILIAAVKEFRENTEPENHNFIIEMNSSKITRKTLKEGQKQFLFQATQRSQKIDYSMFMLPSQASNKKQNGHRNRTHLLRA